MARRVTVLLTGFGPFPGVPENSSARLVAKLGNLAARRFSAHRVVARTLPTEWARGPELLTALYAREAPRVALHFGVSDRAKGFVVELVARNAACPVPDAAGHLPPDGELRPGGPETRASEVPAREIIARLAALKIPAETSEDAGAYLCNAVLYRGLELAAQRSIPCLTGFIHVPHVIASPALKRSESGPVGAFDWDMALTGGLEILRTCLGRPPSARVS